MDLNERRIKKERGMTPKEVLEHFQNYEGELKSAIVIVQYKDEDVHAELSTETNFEAVGILEVIKTDLVNQSLGIYDD